MIVEVVTVLALLTGGSACTLLMGVRGWPLPALGLVVGTSLQILIGTVQVVTGAPTHPALTLALTAGIPVLAWLLLHRRGRRTTPDVGPTLLVAGAAAAAAAALSVSRLVAVTPDSYRYLGVGSLLATNRVGDVMPYTLETRLLAVPVMHAPANITDAFYLQAVGPFLAVATVVMLVWLCRAGLGRATLHPTFTTVAAAAGAALLATNSRFLFHAVYVNGHLLFAALVLLAAGTAWLAALGRLPWTTATPLQAIALATLVLVRPEGALVAGLVALPIVLDRRQPPVSRATVLGALGTSMVVWHGYVVLRYLTDGQDAPASGSVLAVAGLLLVVAALAGRRLLDRLPAVLLVVAEVALWLALAVATVGDPDVLLTSADATVRNLLLGDGGWGVSLVLLGALVVAVLALTSAAERRFLRFPVTTFLPLGALLAYLREGAYRVGPGDSLNRMLLHVLPLAVLVVVAAVDSPWRTLRRHATSSID